MAPVTVSAFMMPAALTFARPLNSDKRLQYPQLLLQLTTQVMTLSVALMKTVAIEERGPVLKIAVPLKQNSLVSYQSVQINREIMNVFYRHNDSATTMVGRINHR